MAKRTTKASFKGSQEAYSAICSDIRAGNFSPIYLLMGEEPYFIDRITEMIATGVLTEDEREFNLNVVYGRDTTGGQISELAMQYPMMASYNIVIVKHAEDASDLDMLAHYVGNEKAMPSSTILVLCYVGKTMDRRSQLYKRIDNHGRVFESVRPRDYEVGAWVKELFRGKGRVIGDKAVAMLVENLGSELVKIDNEADKLLLSLNSRSGEITPDDIEANVGISKDFNSFELTRALSERNGRRAIMIVDYFEKNRSDSNIYGAFSLIFTHFQRIFSLGIMLWSAKAKGLVPPSDGDVMRQLKLASPVFVREYRGALSYYDTQKAFAALGLIRDYEMKVKGVDAGSATAAESLRELILKILGL